MRVKPLVASLSVALILLSSSAWAEQKRICSFASIPKGWIVVNDEHDASNCGNPEDMLIYNIWVIEEYAGHPVGHEMNVCDYLLNKTPTNWTEVDLSNDPLHCSKPKDPYVKNIKRIKRLN